MQIVSYLFSPKLPALITKKWSWLCHFLLKNAMGYELPKLPKITKDQIILIANHQSYFDILLIFCMVHRLNPHLNIKWFAKKELKQIPFVGWTLKLAGVVFLHRSWDQDQEVFKKLNQFESCLYVIFPEGTRRTDQKILDSQEFAKKNQYPSLSYCLLPRTRGFVECIQTLSNLDLIIDLTICYKPKPPKWFDSPPQILTSVSFFEPNQLPSLDLKSWLIERFKLKDQNLKKLYS